MSKAKAAMPSVNSFHHEALKKKEIETYGDGEIKH